MLSFSNLRKNAKFAFILGIIILFIIAVDITELIHTFISIDLRYIFAATGLTVFYLGIRAYIWYKLFDIGDPSTSFLWMLKMYLASYSAKLAVPVGVLALQPVIAFSISKKNYLETERSLSIISLGDFLNMVPLYIISIISLATLVTKGGIPSKLYQYIVGIILASAILSGTVLFVLYRREKTKRYIITLSMSVQRLLRRIGIGDTIIVISENSIIERIDNAYDSIDILFTNQFRLVALFLLSHVGAIAFGSVYWVSAEAVGVSVTISIALLIAVISQIGVAIPSPGGLGGVEAIGVALTLILTSATTAESITLFLVFRIFTYWFVVVLGSVWSDMIIYDRS